MEDLVQYLIEYRYWALFGVALLEGPIASFVAGSVAALGYLDPLAAFGVLAFKDIVFDGLLYGVGRLAGVPFVAQRIATLRAQTGLADRTLGAIEHGWREHPAQLMWVGKLAYGLSIWFMISAGVGKLPFWKFYLYSLPVTVFQFGGLMVLGYFLGTSLWATTSWWLVAVQLIVAAVAVFWAVQMLTRYVRRKYIPK